MFKIMFVAVSVQIFFNNFAQTQYGLCLGIVWVLMSLGDSVEATWKIMKLAKRQLFFSPLSVRSSDEGLYATVLAHDSRKA